MRHAQASFHTPNRAIHPPVGVATARHPWVPSCFGCQRAGGSHPIDGFRRWKMEEHRRSDAMQTTERGKGCLKIGCSSMTPRLAARHRSNNVTGLHRWRDRRLVPAGRRR